MTWELNVLDSMVCMLGAWFMYDLLEYIRGSIRISKGDHRDEAVRQASRFKRMLIPLSSGITLLILTFTHLLVAKVLGVVLLGCALLCLNISIGRRMKVASNRMKRQPVLTIRGRLLLQGRRNKYGVALVVGCIVGCWMWLVLLMSFFPNLL